MSFSLNRRQFLATTAVTATGATAAVTSPPVSEGAEPSSAIDIASRRELFIDDLLIDKLSGGAARRLARPHDEGIAFAFDKPWEGGFSAYVTILHDGDLYRAYYRGHPVAKGDGSPTETTCVAESKDGKVWTKPNLGLFEVHGTRENNCILATTPPFAHNFCPMIDKKPGISNAERYKALAGSRTTGLVPFVSADGLRWHKLREEPVITEGAFDSQNVPFWSEHEQQYVCYFRTFVDKIRRISRTTSNDFLAWTKPVLMEYGGKPVEHLYTNQTHPYFRAPHIYVSIAARFFPGRRVLTKEQADAIKVNPNYFNDCSDGIFQATRGGNQYARTFMDGFLRPGVGLENWVSRTNYPALGVMPTGIAEMSFYANQNYGQPTAHLRRYSLRTDGFVSVSAPFEGGELVTKPLTFSGKELTLNFSGSAGGGVRVEIQDTSGKPLPGFALADAIETIGNELDRVVHWKSGTDVSTLAGKPVRLRFVLKDADLFAFKFA